MLKFEKEEERDGQISTSNVMAKPGSGAALR
jgi:hypothetical protein